MKLCDSGEEGGTSRRIRSSHEQHQTAARHCGEKSGIAADYRGRAICSRELCVSDGAAAVGNEREGLTNVFQLARSRSVAVEQICEKPVCVRDLVPVRDPHRFDSLLQELTGAGRIARHLDRVHRRRVHQEQRTKK